MSGSGPLPPLLGQTSGEGEAYPYKRQRTALACNSCRYRKSRCNGEQPVCGTCSEMGFECVYRRPVNAGKAASELSQAPHNLQQTSHLENRLQAVEKFLHSIASDKSSPQNALYFSRGGQSSIDSSQNHGSGVEHSQEDTVDGMGVITFADEVSTTGCFGPTSNNALFSHITRALASTTNFNNLVQRGDHRQEFDASLSRPVSPPPLLRRQDVGGSNLFVLPSQPEVLRLIDSFFANTGLLFPYIHKKSIVAMVERLDMNRFVGARKSLLCLLNAILAIGTSLDTDSHHPAKLRESASDVFFQRALGLSPWTISNTANLETLQALAVMTQYLQGTSRSAQTWRLHGLLVQAAFQMGVHNSEGLTKSSPLEQEVRTRTWYTCVVLDRMLSMTYGRPPLIHDDYLQTNLPSDVELDDLSDTAEGFSPNTVFGGTSSCSLFIASIKLYRVLSEIVRDMYNHNIVSSRCCRPLSKLDKILKLDRKLQEWGQSLPSSMQLIKQEDFSATQPQDWPFTRSQTILTIRYLHVHFLLYRTVLAEYLDNVAGEVLLEPSPFLDGMLRACSDSPIKLINMIHALAPRPELLPSWWFAAYHVFSASLVVFGLVVVQTIGGVSVPGTSSAALLQSLVTAQEALEKIGCETRIVRRCSKYLQKVIHISTALVRDYASGIFTAHDTSTLNFQVPRRMGASAIDEGGKSPFDPDFAQFLVDDDFNFLDSWADVSQQHA